MWRLILTVVAGSISALRVRARIYAIYPHKQPIDGLIRRQKKKSKPAELVTEFHFGLDDLSGYSIGYNI